MKRNIVFIDGRDEQIIVEFAEGKNAPESNDRKPCEAWDEGITSKDEDSFEKIAEDLEKEPCEYFGYIGPRCAKTCAAYECDGTCEKAMNLDIADRIRKLKKNRKAEVMLERFESDDGNEFFLKCLRRAEGELSALSIATGVLREIEYLITGNREAKLTYQETYLEIRKAIMEALK